MEAMMDETDRQLIALLRQDARSSVATLAQDRKSTRLNSSHSSVSRMPSSA